MPPALHLTPAQLQALEEAKRDNRLSARARNCAKVLVRMAERGKSARSAADDLALGRRQANFAVRTYRTGGVAAVVALKDAQGRPPKITPAKREEVLALAKAQPRLTLRVIAQRAGLSLGTVSGVTRTLGRSRGRVVRPPVPSPDAA
jgi:transposase